MDLNNLKLDLININKLTKKVPILNIKSIRLQNFKAFEDYTFDFSDINQTKQFICLIGPNGSGKSTLLNSIQLLFSRFDGYNEKRLEALMQKSIRHTKDNKNSDFLITAIIQTKNDEYEIKINKNGFIKDHPDYIKLILYRLCYTARFDMELGTFQLERSKWKLFKKMFEAVTGFKIKEEQTIFGQNDKDTKSLLQKYVLGFTIEKPYETISFRDCSDGERKIIKSFSTLLNMEYIPRIIIIDNIEMHVEQKRHFKLIKTIQKAFPKSQIISTTHSYNLANSLGERTFLYDMRLMHSNSIIRKQPWRLQIIDKIEETIMKLKLLKSNKENKQLIREGEKILSLCYCDINDLQQFSNMISNFLEEVTSIFIKNIIMPKI